MLGQGKSGNRDAVLYWEFKMLRRIATSCTLLLALVSAAYGVQREYVAGTILEIRELERDRVQLYVVNTAIMTEEPYYTLAVDVDGTCYEGEFLPRNSHEMLPSFWRAEESISLRLDKHFMYVKREDGSEVKFLVLKKSSLHAERIVH
jgi:hypothetical protein